jgi:hypothetical protein
LSRASRSGAIPIGSCARSMERRSELPGPPRRRPALRPRQGRGGRPALPLPGARSEESAGARHVEGASRLPGPAEVRAERTRDRDRNERSPQGHDFPLGPCRDKRRESARLSRPLLPLAARGSGCNAAASRRGRPPRWSVRSSSRIRMDHARCRIARRRTDPEADARGAPRR